MIQRNSFSEVCNSKTLCQGGSGTKPDYYVTEKGTVLPAKYTDLDSIYDRTTGGDKVRGISSSSKCYR